MRKAVRSQLTQRPRRGARGLPRRVSSSLRPDDRQFRRPVVRTCVISLPGCSLVARRDMRPPTDHPSRHRIGGARVLGWLTIGVSMLVASPSAQLAQPTPEESIRRLELPNRVASQKVEEVVARLGLKPGLVVADIGAGTGVFSRPIARAVLP